MNAEASIESIYQKKTQIEHILLRPDSYIGSIDITSAQLWVMLPGDNKFTYKHIEYVPGLYKIFDELLVNAADNYHRDKSMDTIKVMISKERNSITIWNNGKGIPVQIHKEYNIYVPELIFGHLLTSSNYDDSKKKVTGGRNGYGAKLSNIFSKKFIVQTADLKSRKMFKMIWRDNMSSNSMACIENYNGEEDFTCITFEPDLNRFGMKELDDDIIALMTKRVYDLAGVISNGIKVYINEKRIQIKDFSQYVDLYLKNSNSSNGTNSNDNIKIEDKILNDRWKCIICLSDDQFQQVSFVNSICTIKGGTHVSYVVDQIIDSLMGIIKKKHNDLNIKPYQIKNNIWIFLNCLIENPTFDSQTKETLTLKSSQFGSKYELNEIFLKKILECGILDKIIFQAKMREEAKFIKTLSGSKKSKLLGIPKLEDANNAGTKYADQCTLILTEGDSAKTLAMAGIEIVGRDRYGVFPLKGKLLNVREATTKQISENQEIQNIIKILGLQLGKKYDDIYNLRYGSLMIMADQDHDGSHIKGLIINFIHHFWPSLLKINGFLKEFITPLIKATRHNEVMTFFSMNDFKKWLLDHNIDIKQWRIKYYKGLGTSTNQEAQEYFNNLSKHQINFKYLDDHDDNAIELAFSKKKVDERKEWLLNYNKNMNDIIDYNRNELRYTDFVNKELIQFSILDNIRSIPSLCDGLKPGQRKILYSCFKRNLINEIKVAQLAGYVAEHSAYHHGEQSLSQTIIGMAQNFVGSNNINLLMPIGQFGSRNMGGKEAASARYIFTSLNKITRMLFKEDDDHLYRYLEDDGQSVEPEWYLPIIPLVLVNGADGIGTGWSTSIPCYNPRDICQNILNKLKGEEFNELIPWFKNYKGKIEQISNNIYLAYGKYEILDDETIRIYELPITRWIKEYKMFLEELMNPEEGGGECEILDIKEYHTLNDVNFIIKLPIGKIRDIQNNEGGIEKKFKLSTMLSASNMVLFGPDGQIKKYNSSKEIMEEFYEIRMKFYEKRKIYILSRLKRELEIIENKRRFIIGVIDNDIQIKNIKLNVVIENLIRKNFKKMKDITRIQSSKNDMVDEEYGLKECFESENLSVNACGDYEYLLNMPMWSLTYEVVEKLNKEYNKKQEELGRLKMKTIKEMYEEDINKFLDVLDEIESKENRQKGTKNGWDFMKNHLNSEALSRKNVVKKSKKVGNNCEEENATKINHLDMQKSKKLKLEGVDSKNKIDLQKDVEESLQQTQIPVSENDVCYLNGSSKNKNREQSSKNHEQISKNHEENSKNYEQNSKNPEQIIKNSEKFAKNDKTEANEAIEIQEISTLETLSIPIQQNIIKTEELISLPNLSKKPKIKLRNSLLKYFFKRNRAKLRMQKAKIIPKSREITTLSLMERIKLRQLRGEASAFEKAYLIAKQSSLKPTNLMKRKPENYLESECLKKIKNEDHQNFDRSCCIQPKQNGHLSQISSSLSSKPIKLSLVLKRFGNNYDDGNGDGGGEDDFDEFFI